MGSNDPTNGVPNGSFGRRTFLKGAGTLAALGVTGVSATGSAAAADGFDESFLNFRGQEAAKVWARGYRGRPDRSISLTDSGVDSRHPDEGPWNGITALIRDGEVKLTRPENNNTRREETGETESFSGTAGPGTFATGEEFYHEFTTPEGVEELDATLSWSPSEPANDLEFGLDKLVDGEYERVVTAATASEPETFSVAVEPGHQYRFVGEHYLNVTSTYEISGTYFEIKGNVTFVGEDKVFTFPGADGNVKPHTPKTIGWYDAGSRYGSYEKPRDGNGHGSHVAGIMSGSGRASTVDADAAIEDEPRAVLTVGDFLEYEVDAQAGTGVFGSAYGELIELAIEGPNGRELDATTTDSDGSRTDNVIVEAPTVHDSGTATYSVYVRPAGGQTVSTARAERVAAGPFLPPEETDATGQARARPRSTAGSHRTPASSACRGSPGPRLTSVTTPRTSRASSTCAP